MKLFLILFTTFITHSAFAASIPCATLPTGAATGHRDQLSSGGYGFCTIDSCRTELGFEALPAGNKCVTAAVASWFTKDQLATESTAQLSIRGQLARAATSEVRISLTTSNSDPGNMFELLDPVAVFPAGSTLSNPIRLQLKFDRSSFSNQNVKIGYSNVVSGSASISALNILNVTIQNVDSEPGLYTISSATVTEGDTASINFNFSRPVSNLFPTILRIQISGVDSRVLTRSFTKILGKGASSISYQIPTVALADAQGSKNLTIALTGTYATSVEGILTVNDALIRICPPDQYDNGVACVPEIYLATYTEFPASSVVEACMGQQIVSRQIATCVRERDGTATPGKCVDTDPTTTYQSPAGFVSERVDHGNQRYHCDQGSETRTIADLICDTNPDYYNSNGTCLLETYAATYSQYAANTVTTACKGTQVAPRSIETCVRLSDNSPVALNKCTDSVPTITYQSPAGEVSQIVFGGTQYYSCGLGLELKVATRLECNPGYVSNGTTCTVGGTPDMPTINLTQYQSKNNFGKRIGFSQPVPISIGTSPGTTDVEFFVRDYSSNTCSGQGCCTAGAGIVLAQTWNYQDLSTPNNTVAVNVIGGTNELLRLSMRAKNSVSGTTSACYVSSTFSDQIIVYRGWDLTINSSGLDGSTITLTHLSNSTVANYPASWAINPVGNHFYFPVSTTSFHTFVATPAGNAQFKSWSGCLGTSAGTVCDVSATAANRAITPIFECKAGFKAAGNICSICPAGSVQPLAGQLSCNSCPAGQYQPLQGQTSCSSCTNTISNSTSITFAGGGSTSATCPIANFVCRGDFVRNLDNMSCDAPPSPIACTSDELPGYTLSGTKTFNVTSGVYDRCNAVACTSGNPAVDGYCDGPVMAFSANDSTGSALWLTDGTIPGTRKSVFKSTATNRLAFVGSKTSVNGKFLAWITGPSGTEPYISDGTDAGTTLLADLNPGTGSSFYASPETLVVGGKFYFVAKESTSGPPQVFASNGTTVTKVAGQSAINGNTLLTTDNTYAFLTSTAVVFAASTAANGSELWLLETSNDTMSLIRDHNPGAASSNPVSFVSAYSGRVYFVYSSSPPNQPTNSAYRTDGTAAGTVAISPTLNPAVFAYGTYEGLASGTGLGVLDGNLFYHGYVTVANTLPSCGGLQTQGYQFTRYTAANALSCQQYFSNTLGSGTPYISFDNRIVFGGKLFYTVQQVYGGSREVFVTTGGPGIQLGAFSPSTNGNPSKSYEYNGRVYWSQNAGTSAAPAWDLISSDGTPAGTYKVAALSAKSPLNNMKVFNGKLYFSASVGTTGGELWVTDGSSAGTKMVKEINTTLNVGGLDSNPWFFVP